MKVVCHLDLRNTVTSCQFGWHSIYIIYHVLGLDSTLAFLRTVTEALGGKVLQVYLGVARLFSYFHFSPSNGLQLLKEGTLKLSTALWKTVQKIPGSHPPFLRKRSAPLHSLGPSSQEPSVFLAILVLFIFIQESLRHLFDSAF